MPSERRGTVLEDVSGYLQRLRGTSEWRADRAGTIRTPIAVVCVLVALLVRNAHSELILDEFPCR